LIKFKNLKPNPENTSAKSPRFRVVFYTNWFMIWCNSNWFRRVKTSFVNNFWFSNLISMIFFILIRTSKVIEQKKDHWIKSLRL
jgi:hypothetical protein